MQASRSASVWSDCSRVPEAHEPLAKAEEDGVGLPGHDYDDNDDNDNDFDDDLYFGDDIHHHHPPIRSYQLT